MLRLLLLLLSSSVCQAGGAPRNGCTVTLCLRVHGNTKREEKKNELKSAAPK
jgi:hypothetical protein